MGFVQHMSSPMHKWSRLSNHYHRLFRKCLAALNTNMIIKYDVHWPQTADCADTTCTRVTRAMNEDASFIMLRVLRASKCAGDWCTRIFLFYTSAYLRGISDENLCDEISGEMRGNHELYFEAEPETSQGERRNGNCSDG
jgi:hypothetical protein